MVDFGDEGCEARREDLIDAACKVAPEIPRPTVVRIARAVVRYQQQSLLRELNGFQPGVTSILWTGLASMRSAGGKHHVFEEGSKPDSAGLSVH